MAFSPGLYGLYPGPLWPLVRAFILGLYDLYPGPLWSLVRAFMAFILGLYCLYPEPLGKESGRDSAQNSYYKRSKILSS